jgi:hypothetical protein
MTAEITSHFFARRSAIIELGFLWSAQAQASLVDTAHLQVNV